MYVMVGAGSGQFAHDSHPFVLVASGARIQPLGASVRSSAHAEKFITISALIRH